MQVTAPFNTDVAEFQPNREAPIYPSIVRRYPCQENNIVGDENSNDFRSLTWKIQQPDASMVWSSVKLVMPATIVAYDSEEDQLDMRVCSRLPACNIALSESPMRVFRDTTLSLNGKIFNEVNYYRSALDACYRGVGPQSYGDNHSLKPVVTRALYSRNPTQHVVTRLADGTPEATYVRIDDIKDGITSNNESLLDNNGPFLERARLFQDNLSEDGTVWTGDISAYLEIGPFQARARKGNTAVPYVQDFHMKLNFNQVEARYDQLMNSKWSHDPEGKGVRQGRVLAPYLLEFGTVSNMHIVGEPIEATAGFMAYVGIQFTAKPYLEITYTKFLDPMRSSYLLRCFERQYQQSLPRFKLRPREDAKVTARVTSRLLSYPTKIYLYAEVADEWKGAFKNGGVRRSCALSNIHCRINQRPDVIYNPSQEECFETFQRHTNSSLEYGAWRKSPIYVFTPADLKQSDMYANDARITWIEWDAEVALTPLQEDENYQATLTQAISASGYVETNRSEIITANYANFLASTQTVEFRCDPRVQTIRHGDATNSLQLFTLQTGGFELKIPKDVTGAVVGKPLIQMPYLNQRTGTEVPVDSGMDISVTNIQAQSMVLDGFIWGLMATAGPNAGQMMNGQLYMVPRSYRFIIDDSFPCGTEASFVNPFSMLEVTVGAQDAKGDFIYVYQLHAASLNTVTTFRGIVSDRRIAAGDDGKHIGYTVANADWADARPGISGYMFDPAGIRNADITIRDNQAGNQTYNQMGRLPFVVGGGTNNRANAVNETQATADTHRWVCFAPPAHWANGADQAWKYRSNTHQTLHDATSPVTIPQGSNPVYQLGAQRVFFRGRAQNANIDGANQTPYLTAQNPAPVYNISDGRRLAELIPNVPSESAIHEDYQLKVLYEYGNCQYEFSEQALPTRVLENLQPVSASAGIPSL